MTPEAGRRLTGPPHGCALSATLVVLILLGSWSVVPDRLFEITLVEYHGFYEPVARSLLTGAGLTLPDGSPALTYPPGFPVVLAATFAVASAVGIDESSALRVLILVCFAATAVLIHRIAMVSWGARWAMLAPLLFAIYPPALWMSLQPTSEVVFLPVLAAAVLFALKTARTTDPTRIWLWAIAAGAAAGAAMLIRPAAIGGPVVLAAVAAVERGRVGRPWALPALLIVTTAAFAVGPWLGYASFEAGRLVPLSTNGGASVHDGLTFAIRDKGYRSQSAPPKGIEAYMRAVDSRWQQGDRRILEIAVEEAVANPRGAIAVAAWKSLRAWYGTDSRRLDRWVALAQLPFVVLLAVAAWRAWHLGGAPRVLSVLVLALVAYSWLVTIAALSILRYLTPALCLAWTLAPGLSAGRPHRFREPLSRGKA